VRLAIAQEVDHPALLEIAQDRAVTLAAPPRPVIDPKDARAPLANGAGPSPNEAQQRVGAYRQPQALRQASTGLPAKHVAEMTLEVAEPLGPAATRADDARQGLG